MTRRLWMIAVCVGLLANLSFAQGTDAERKQLQDRFKQRYPTLVRLQKAGVVGETYQGLAEVTPQGDGKAVAEGSQTVADFLAAENKDRRRLYDLLAQETGATPEQVAQRDANRRFQRAEPEEWLMIREGRWVQKKDLQRKGG